MIKRFSLILLAILSFTALKSQDKDYSKAIELIEVWLEAQKDYENLPGLSAIAVHDQEVIWKGGFGQLNIEENVAAKSNSIYSICSISKLFTSVAIMKLYDEGKLRLDDEVKDILPHFNIEQQHEASGPITVRGLLTHSSGLPRESAHGYWSHPDYPFPTKEEIKAELGDQKTLYPAVTYFQYSNLGMSILGQIVEEVSGQDYDTYVLENILKPLGLEETRSRLPEDKYGSQLAVGYGFEDRDGTREKISLFQANGITPAAGFSSTVEDLGKFASWQFRLRDSSITEILKPSTLKNMQRVHYTDPGWNTTWGLGFSVFKNDKGGTTVGHGGSCPGYQSTLRVVPKSKMAYSVMINGGGTSPTKYSNGIAALLEKYSQKNEKEAEDEKVSTDLSEYTGYYDSQPWWGEEYITQWKDKLIILNLPSNNPSSAITELKQIEGDIFRSVRKDGELAYTFKFNRDNSGNVTSYTVNYNTSPKIK